VSHFDVYVSAVAGGVVVQEVPGYFNTSGAYIRKIEIANLPTDTSSVTLEYRRAGDTGPYLAKAASPGSSAGLFYLNYDEIPNGVYEYRLKGADGNLLTGTNSSGTLTIKRGAEATSTQLSGTGGTLTPLTTIQRDIFGNSVHQVRHAGGAASAGVAGYTAALASLDDQHTTRNTMPSATRYRLSMARASRLTTPTTPPARWRKSGACRPTPTVWASTSSSATTTTVPAGRSQPLRC